VPSRNLLPNLPLDSACFWDHTGPGDTELSKRGDLIVEGLVHILGLASRRFGQG